MVWIAKFVMEIYPHILQGLIKEQSNISLKFCQLLTKFALTLRMLEQQKLVNLAVFVAILLLKVASNSQVRSSNLLKN